MSAKLDKAIKEILIVEDDEVIQGYLKSLLEDLGYVGITCVDGSQAQNKISDSAPILILMDILLPDMDGLSLCRKIKSDPKTRQIPVIMLSCLSDSDAIRRADSYGACDFIAKPFTRAELKSKIERALS